MAISISLSASKGSYNSATSSTQVYVSIVAYYSGGSFNRNASLTVTVNGSQQSSTVSINGSESTSSGSTTIYSGTWNINHTTTTTIYCHASLYAGGTTGTTTDSASVTLTVPNSGGGDSGGGDDDDIFEGGGSTPTPSTPYIIRIIPEDHTYIKVISTGYGYELTDGITVSDGYDLTVFFDVDDGYILDTHTINGTTINSGESYIVNSNTAIRASAIENPIDSSLATKTYQNCKATGLTNIYKHIVHNYKGEGGELPPKDVSSTTCTEYGISSAIQIQYYYKDNSSEDYSYNHAYAITFITPDVKNISSLRFKFIVNDISTLEYDINYSLTTNKSNLTDYVNFNTDQYSIASGIISKSTLSSGSTVTLDIDTNKIESDKTYYLVLYQKNRSTTTSSLPTNTDILL